MTNFYVGQKVVCIVPDDGPEHGGESFWGPACGLKPSGVYTIRWVGPVRFETGPAIGVRLNEIRRDISLGRDVAFGASRFRPTVDKPDAIELFRKMCRDAEAGKLVDA